MWKSILKELGLYKYMDHLREVNNLEDEVVKERRLSKALREDIDGLPYQMDYLVQLYSKEQVDAMFHKLANKVRAKYPELIDKWLKRLKDAKIGKLGKESKGN